MRDPSRGPRSAVRRCRDALSRALPGAAKRRRRAPAARTNGRHADRRALPLLRATGASEFGAPERRPRDRRGMRTGRARTARCPRRLASSTRSGRASPRRDRRGRWVEHEKRRLRAASARSRTGAIRTLAPPLLMARSGLHRTIYRAPPSPTRVLLYHRFATQIRSPPSRRMRAAPRAPFVVSHLAGSPGRPYAIRIGYML